MDEFIRIGVDLGKRFFQIHGVRSGGGPAEKRKLSRSKMHAFFSGLAPCRVGMEACGSAHYWARELGAMGHEVVLMPPAYIKPYVKRGKNDAIDAAAICEAMARPDMRFVPVKSADQQALLMLHKTRELMVKQRTMSVNALRSHLAEFGLVVAQGVGRIDDLTRSGGEQSVPAGRGKTGDEAVGSAYRSAHPIHRRHRAQNRQGRRRQSDQPAARPRSRGRPGDRLGDRGERAQSRRLQVGTRLRGLARAHAKARTRAAARPGSAASPRQGNRYIRKLLVVGDGGAPPRRQQTQRSARRLDRRLAEKKARARRHGGARQQSWREFAGRSMTTGEFFRQETFARA